MELSPFVLVFLDLPAPWDAVAHAKTTLRVSDNFPLNFNLQFKYNGVI